MRQRAVGRFSIAVFCADSLRALACIRNVFRTDKIRFRKKHAHGLQKSIDPMDRCFLLNMIVPAKHVPPPFSRQGRFFENMGVFAGRGRARYPTTSVTGTRMPDM